jgi:hypothetical protein
MKKKYLPYAGMVSAGILIIMFIVIFFSGCLSFLNQGITNSLPGKSTSEESMIWEIFSQNTIPSGYINSTAEVPLQNTSPALTPQSELCINSSRFITIDTLPDIWVNQTYNFTGTTNLPPGEELLVRVLPLEYDITVNPIDHSMYGTMTSAVGTVSVVKGNGSTNRWSFELQTGRLDPSVHNYLVNVSNDPFDSQVSATVSGDTFCTQKFSLKS